MKKINKVKIKINGKKCIINPKMTLKEVIARFKIPLDKVAIELNKEIVNKSRSDNEVYYNRETSREQSLLKPLLGFHNYWVKNQFLYRRFSGTNSLFEIACGKGGDLHKVAKGKFKLVVGSDINKDNLYNVSAFIK